MRSRIITASAVAALVAGLSVASVPARADDKWWPVKLHDVTTGKDVDFSPPEKAAKAWNICVLFPHMKDTFWVAVDYGIAMESKRLGVNMTLYQAGGYENLPKQLSQFDDCMASGFDAIVVGAISEAGLSKKFKEAAAAGKPVISTANPVDKAETASKIFVDFEAMGAQTGKYLVDDLQGKPAKVVAFPGPAGSGWAESFVGGFKNGIKGTSSIELLDEKFGDSGVAVQLGLVQNALQAYPDLTVVWGTAPTAEAAIGAVADAGRKDVLILSSYENQAMMDALKKKEILGFATQYPVVEGAFAIDAAVQILEHQPYIKFAQPLPDMISAANMDKINMSLVLAPADFKAVYSVKAK